MMTPAQRKLYDFIADFIRKNGHGPSYREIAEGLGVKSLSGISKLVTLLENRGFLTRDRYCARSIKLLPLDQTEGVVDSPSNLQKLVDRLAQIEPDRRELIINLCLAITEYNPEYNHRKTETKKPVLKQV